MPKLYVVGCLLTKENRQNSASSFDVVEDAVEIDCGVRFSCCCQIDMAVSGEQAQEANAFLRNNLTEGNEFQLKLLAFPPLGLVHLRPLSVLS